MKLKERFDPKHVERVELGEYIVAQLTMEFKTPPVRIVWNGGTRGRYWGSKSRIDMGIDAHMGIEATAIHEYAHHLTLHYSGPGLRHNEIFTNHLITCVKFFYGEDWVERYPWHAEYKSVIRNAAKIDPAVREQFRWNKSACLGKNRKGQQCIKYGRLYVDQAYYCRTCGKKARQQSEQNEPAVPAALQTMLTIGGQR